MIRLVLFSFLCLLLIRYPAHAEIVPSKIYVTKAGNEQIFLVEVANPSSAVPSLQPNWYLGRSPRPYLPRLIGNDPWDVQAFLEYEPIGYGQRVAPGAQLTFIGKTKSTGPLSLRLEYQDSSLAWKTEPITVNFSGAKEVPLREPPRTPAQFSGQRFVNGRPVTPAPTPSMSIAKLTTPQRWALAEANWFNYLSNIFGDIGGFYTFAENQTRRTNGLPFSTIPTSVGPPVWGGGDLAQRLYETTTGAISLQEALQLDRMQTESRSKEARTVDIASVAGIATKSLPFDQMRMGKQPTAEPLAGYIPRDNYYLAFRDIGKLLRFFDFLDDWGSQFLDLFEPSAADYSARDKLHEQLCLPNSALSKIFGPAIIGSAAITGSDPYLREGSDVSVLFDVTQKDVFSGVVQLSFDAAKTTHPEAVYSSEATPQGKIESLQSPDRRISCHRAWLDNVMIYSNSKIALKRILAAKAKPADSLAETPDFKYARAVVYPFDPNAEDGMLFLSDDFLRSVSSPQMRIKEKRRIEALTSLKMVTNGYLLEGFHHGAGKYSFDQLVADKAISKADLDLGDKDNIGWDSEQQRATSSTYGTVSFMTPLIELPIDKISATEKSAYETFRQGYEFYWRRYFDPVAVRIRNDKDVEFNVTILPLIEQSGYESLKDVTGGNPVTLHLADVPDATLFRALFHLNPASHEVQSLKQFAGGMLGSAPVMPQLPGQQSRAPGEAAPVLDWIGEWITFWIEDSDAYTKLLKHSYERADGVTVPYDQDFIDLFDVGIVLGIQAKNPLSVAGFLVGLRSMVQTTAPGTVYFKDLPPYKNVTIVQIGPDPQGEWYQELIGARPNYGSASPVPTPSADKIKAMENKGIFYAALKGGLYFATKASALQNLIDKVDNSATVGSESREGNDISGNTIAYISPGNKKALGSARYYVEQVSRDACIGNLGAIYALGRAGIISGPLKDGVETPLLGYRAICPSGGGYSYDPASDTASSDIYGSVNSLKRRDDMSPDSRAAHVVDSIQRLVSGLGFTEHGLTARIKIERRQAQ